MTVFRTVSRRIRPSRTWLLQPLSFAIALTLACPAIASAHHRTAALGAHRDDSASVGTGAIIQAADKTPDVTIGASTQDSRPVAPAASGGDGGGMRAAPRWHSFLPGMFR